MKTIINRATPTFLLKKLQNIELIKIILFSLSLLSINSNFYYAQDNLNYKVFDQVDQKPSFPGGNEKLYDFLMNNVQYRNIAAKGVHGIVHVQFDVDRKGEISNVKVIKSDHCALNNEALRVVYLMPDWVPARQNGTIVSSRFVLPIHFQTYNG